VGVRRERLTKRQLLGRLSAANSEGMTSYRRAGGVPDLRAISIDQDSAEAFRGAMESSATGFALFAWPSSALLVVPPFPIEADLDAPNIDDGPLVDLLARPRVYAVFLLRLGGFSVGFFRGDSLVDSKTDQRFVKNRHRKGGQSSRRFERIREKQIDELFDKACVTVRDRLAPYEREIEHVFLGGDRRTLQSFRKVCDYFDSFGERLMPRVLHLTGDPRKAALEAMPREVWSSDVWTYDRDIAPDGAT
jgi:hypothetical protein